MLTHNLSFRFKALLKTRRYHLESTRVGLQRLAVPALAIGTLALGAGAGVLASQLHAKIAQVALGGIALALISLSKPEFMILLMVALSSTVVDPKTLPGVYRLTAVELCLFILFGVLAARILSNKGKEGFLRTPLDWPVLLFLVAGTISLFNAKYNLETYNDKSFRIWRLFFDYMVFFAVTNFIKTRRQLMTLVGGMLIMATIVAGFMIAQQAVGPSAVIIPGHETVGTATVFKQDFSGVARISISGSAIVYIMVMPAFVLHTMAGQLKTRKWFSFIPVVLLPVAIAFTFDRNMWIGATLAAAIFVLVAQTESKKLVFLLVILAILASLLIPLASVYYPRIDSIIEALSARVNSLFTGDELLYDASTQWRLTENKLAIPKIKEYPILGMGLGAEYRPLIRYNDNLTHFIHNAYLFLLVDAGIIGFLPFLWFSIAYLIRGFSSWYKLHDPFLRMLILSFTVAYVSVLSSSMTSPRLLESAFTLPIGVVLGVNEVAIRLGQQSSGDI